tara:strand:- start:9680 stop:10075 length:396 start_codon:yes stop_codon:yes gene_type:complete
MSKRVVKPDELASVIANITSEAIRRTEAEVAERIIRRTPVQTGTARGNWNSSLNSPDRSINNTADRNGSRQTRKAKVVLQKAELNDTFYLTNALPYVSELERGSSTQAPQGMVALSVAEHEAIFKKVVRKL